MNSLNYIRNFLRIDDRLATSGRPKPSDFAAPCQAGFEVLVNLAMLTSDQRGAPRPFNFGSITNATGGDGSGNGAFELGSPQINIRQVGILRCFRGRRIMETSPCNLQPISHC